LNDTFFFGAGDNASQCFAHQALYGLLVVGFEDKPGVPQPLHVSYDKPNNVRVFVDAFHRHNVREHTLRVAIAYDQAFDQLTFLTSCHHCRVAIRSLRVL
jgi:hypothetical protein